jgi:branched-subunit amino acid ABC-type transport system permease component
MINTLAYGLTVGGILYIISIGLSFTFGTMRIVNFAHALVYTLGAYVLVSAIHKLSLGFFASAVLAVTAVVPVAYATERFVIRRLYGQSIDYAIIATYAVLLIGVDAIKWIWGATPIPLSDPIGISFPILGVDLPAYRLIIILLSVCIFAGIEIFFSRTIIGKVIVAGLEDREAVTGIGISVDKYFALAFILGSYLAALGGVLYAPITTVHPYMGFQVLLLSFAIVLIGGLGSTRGTFLASFAMGLVMSVTARYWGPAAEAVVFLIMALSLIIKPIEV